MRTALHHLYRWLSVRARRFLKGPDPRWAQQRNIWHLYQDLVWLGITTAVGTYTNVYAIRLGASKHLLGLKASVPSLITLILRLPAAQWMERTDDRQRLIVRSLLAARAIYFAIFLLPWLNRLPLLRDIPPAYVLVGLVLLMNVPNAISAAGWDAFFADVVPEQLRARVIGTRNMMTHLAMLLLVPLIGAFLEWVSFPLNYQLVYLMAFIGAMGSVWHVHRIRVPPTAAASRRRTRGITWREVRDIFRGNREFTILVAGIFVYQWAVNLAAPLFSVYYVQVLGASESWIGLRTTIASIVSILAFRFWPPQLERYGEQSVLRIVTPLTVLFPLLTGLTGTLTPHLFIVAIPRLFASAAMLARYNLLLRISPDDRRPTYIALYAILFHSAATVAPMVGVWLSDLIGLRNVFFVAAGLRLLASVFYWKLPEPQTR